jgi:hypothetical protein
MNAAAVWRLRTDDTQVFQAVLPVVGQGKSPQNSILKKNFLSRIHSGGEIALPFLPCL